jgi:hypothetical protein
MMRRSVPNHAVVNAMLRVELRTESAQRGCEQTCHLGSSRLRWHFGEYMAAEHRRASASSFHFLGTHTHYDGAEIRKFVEADASVQPRIIRTHVKSS